MATCQCNCPASSRPVCSHLAAVACASPLFRLRLALFVICQWKLGKHPRRRETLPKGTCREVAQCITRHFTAHQPSEKRRSKHRGHMMSDDASSLEELPQVIKRDILLGVVEAFVALFLRMLQNQQGSLPTITVSHIRFLFQPASVCNV